MKILNLFVFSPSRFYYVAWSGRNFKYCDICKYKNCSLRRQRFCKKKDKVFDAWDILQEVIR